MKALVYYGPEDMRYVDVDTPVPGPGEVRIRVKATGICGSDVHGYLGITGRRTPPMIMGHEFAGIVDSVGDGVTAAKPGDRVTAQPVNFCGKCAYCHEGLTNLCTDKEFLGVMDVNGSMAEFVCVPEKLIYKLPDSVSYTQGAVVEPLAVASRAVESAGNLEGQNLLIVGAGTIGLLVLQAAKLHNPAKIIVTDLSASRLAAAKNLGADETVNPSEGGAMDKILGLTGGKGVDVSIEAVGVTPTVKQALEALRPGGRCVWIGNSAKMVELNMQDVVTREKNIHGTYIFTHKGFGKALDLLASGKIETDALISAAVTMQEAPAMFARMGKGADDLIKVMITDEK